MPQNTAAWQVEPKATPVQVKPAPYTTPKAGEILIQNHAVAFNPVDAFLQLQAIFPIPYPHVLGSDVAGEVIEVGDGVTRFQTGDRVFGFACGSTANNSAEGAFQAYTILHEDMASSIPAAISFADAAVLPMGINVAATGLFADGYLGLRHPSLGTASTDGGALLIWGGATSMGCVAIQLATAAGYEVMATCSKKNFDLVRRLGASQAFDYQSDSVIDDIVAALKGKTVVGAFDAAGKMPDGAFGGAAEGSSFFQCATVLQQTEGSKFVAAVQFLPEQLPGGIRAKFILGFQIKELPLCKVIWEDFATQALASGKLVPAPEPLVVGHGLESIQSGLDAIAKGVSARKVVVTL